MNLLAIETSTSESSVAMEFEGKLYTRSLSSVNKAQQKAEEKAQRNPKFNRRRTDQPGAEDPEDDGLDALGLVQSVLEDANIPLNALDAIIFSQGPGSFVGTHLAEGAVQGLAYIANVPVINLSSLQILAQTAHRQHGWSRLCIALDAKMHAVYHAVYELSEGIMVLKGAETALIPSACKCPKGKGVAIGNAWKIYDLPVSKGFKLFEADIYPDAQDMLILAQKKLETSRGGPANMAVPSYLRGTDLWKKTRRRE